MKLHEQIIQDVAGNWEHLPEFAKEQIKAILAEIDEIEAGWKAKGMSNKELEETRESLMANAIIKIVEMRSKGDNK